MSPFTLGGRTFEARRDVLKVTPDPVYVPIVEHFVDGRWARRGDYLIALAAAAWRSVLGRITGSRR